MPLYVSIKNILWIGVFLVVTPFFISLLKDQYGGFLNPQNRVGIIVLDQTITESTHLIQQLNSFFKDQTIKGIAFHMNCSGGALGSAQLLHHEIEYLKKEYPKPIITLVENICTAEGYVVACATDAIIAPAGALIGGIYPPYAHNKEFEYVVSRDNENVQKVTDDAYNYIITAIAHKRKLSLKEQDLWGKQIFTGYQAVKMHLVDQVGSLLDVQRIIKEKALLDGDIQWVGPLLKESLVSAIKKMVGF